MLARQPAKQLGRGELPTLLRGAVEVTLSTEATLVLRSLTVLPVEAKKKSRKLDYKQVGRM